jgi:hypothetical protein
MLLIAPTFDRYAPAEDVRLEAAPKSLLSVCRGERVFSAGVRVSGNSTIVSSLCGQLRQRMFRTCSQYASVGDLRSPMIAWATSSWQFIHPVSSSVSSSCTILTWYSLPCSCVMRFLPERPTRGHWLRWILLYRWTMARQVGASIGRIRTAALYAALTSGW